MLITYPYLGDDSGEISFPGQLLFTAVLAVSVWAVSRKRLHFFIAITLAIPSLAGNWLDISQATPSLVRLIDCCRIIFYSTTTAMVLAHVFSGWAFAGDKLLGALAAYLLIGITFTWAYEFIHTLNPNAFTFTHDANITTGMPGNWRHFIYFSFATLTTLGYGDITPHTPAAQSVAMLEAVAGILYPAVLISWVVSSLRANQLK